MVRRLSILHAVSGRTFACVRRTRAAGLDGPVCRVGLTHAVGQKKILGSCPVPSPASNRSLEGGNEAGSTPSARAAAEIIAITTRDDFLLEIGEALSGQTSVRPVDSVDTAVNQLGVNRKTTQLIAIDAREVDD